MNLQDIALGVNNKLSSTFTVRGSNVSATYTRQEPCSNSRVHISDGSIFIEGYDKKKYMSGSVKQNHLEIINAKKNNDNNADRYYQSHN